MLLRGEILYWGTPLLQFLPWHEFAIQSLAAGHLPLWNPWLGMGAPLLANHQSAVLYPPNLLLALVGPAWGQGLLVCLHLIWAGVGMVYLTRRLGIRTLGQSIAAAAYPMSAYLVARAGFLSMNAALSWIPWVVLAGVRLAQSAGPWKGRLAAMAGLSLVLALQWLAGHAQTAWYTLWILWPWMLWFANDKQGRRGLGQVAVLGLGSMALAAAMTLAQILPTLEYWRESQRAAGVAASAALTYSLWPWRVLGILAPDLFGSPAGGDFWGYGNYWEDALYVGLLPLLLATSAILRSLRSSAGGPAGFHRLQAGLAALGLFLALGNRNPVYLFLFQHVPTFNAFQGPARWSILLVFGLITLAAFGADAWQPARGRALYWIRLGTAGALAGLFVSLAAASLQTPLEPSIPRALAGAALGFFLAGALALSNDKLQISQWAPIVVVVVLADLAAAGEGLNPAAPQSLAAGPSRIASLDAEGHRLYMPAGLEYEIKFRQTHRFDRYLPVSAWGVVRDSGLPNTTALDSVASANNFDPLVSRRYADWLLGLEGPGRGDLESKWLPLMDVAWLAEPASGGSPGANYRPVEGPEPARLVPGAVCEPDPEAAASKVFLSGLDPESTIVLEGCVADESERQGGVGAVQRVPTSDPNASLVNVVSDKGGWLLLADAWFPGWVVTVNGEPTRVYPADLTFRAVWVPAGNHHVEFHYRPWTFGLGAWVSVVAWTAWFWIWRRRG